MDHRYFYLFISGLIGGITADAVSAPLPYLLGGFLGASIFVLFYERDERQLPKLTKWIRLIFVSIIGTLIAMSLNFNPIVVALHHFLRLFLSVWFGSLFTRYLKDQESNP